MHTQTPPSARLPAMRAKWNERERDRKSAKVKYGRAHLARSLASSLTKLLNAFSYLQAGFLNSVPTKLGPARCIYAKCARALL